MRIRVTPAFHLVCAILALDPGLAFSPPAHPANPRSLPGLWPNPSLGPPSAPIVPTLFEDYL